MDDRIADAVEHAAVLRLQAGYADAVTRRAWHEVAGLFAPGAAITIDLRASPPIELQGGEAIADMIAGACERFAFFELTMLNAVAHLDPGLRSAHGRIFQCEVRQDSATQTFTQAYGVYRDEYARIGDDWRFARRRYSSLARTAADPAAPGLELFPMPSWER